MHAHTCPPSLPPEEGHVFNLLSGDYRARSPGYLGKAHVLVVHGKRPLTVQGNEQEANFNHEQQSDLGMEWGELQQRCP
jgi:hypothetical protein